MIAKVIGKAVVSLIVILCLAAFFVAFQYYRYLYDKPLQVSSEGLIVVVPPGSSFQKVADSLSEAKILKHPEWFMIWVHLTGARGKLKTGEYMVKAGTTPQELIKLLVSGKVLQYPLTIVDGWTFERLLQAINDAPKIKHTLLGMSQAEVAAKLGMGCVNLEGLFYPDTYHFPANTTDIAFLQRANKNMNDKLQNLWKNRSTDVLKTPYEALILASIIQKESGYVDEYPEIAGVYIRRLERNMPLQADPTVIYGLGKTYAGKLTFDHLKKPSPYNTYLNTGLPPTPIAMPNMKAIEAAMNPKSGTALYFVATGTDKRHVFSDTLQEHQQAVLRYRAAIANGVNVPVQTEQVQPQIQTQMPFPSAPPEVPTPIAPSMPLPSSTTGVNTGTGTGADASSGAAANITTKNTATTTKATTKTKNKINTLKKTNTSNTNGKASEAKTSSSTSSTPPKKATSNQGNKTKSNKTSSGKQNSNAAANDNNGKPDKNAGNVKKDAKETKGAVSKTNKSQPQSKGLNSADNKKNKANAKNKANNKVNTTKNVDNTNKANPVKKLPPKANSNRSGDTDSDF